ncbi:MAG: PaaI family thioesterase [Paludibacteraceae bacterium]|nr:PaaI family thioesterase [Paludibacteraceae bacterium]
MKKIKNPWVNVEGYHCFGCAPHNESGLQMEFYEDGEDVVSTWNPDHHFQGWINTLHGGIQCALLDEIAGWVVVQKLKTCGVTSKLETRFVKGIDITQGEITLKARIKEMKRNIAVIDAEIYNNQAEVCTKAEIQYFTYPQTVAKEKFYFRELTTEE